MQAGWSGKAEKNVRPAQWLGLLKIFSAWGAEWFYAGFFNVAFDSHRQMPDSGQWCWQGMSPSYAQAVATQAADFTYKGNLVMADPASSYVTMLREHLLVCLVCSFVCLLVCLVSLSVCFFSEVHEWSEC
jgi:hypothetical protein